MDNKSVAAKAHFFFYNSVHNNKRGAFSMTAQ